MARTTSRSQPTKVFDVHLLDMGARKYGDCLLCRVGRKVILIDGGHLGDQIRRDPGFPSIPEQLEEILGRPSAAAAVEKKLLAQFTCLGLGW